MEKMALETKGPEAVKNLLTGRGIGLILKSLTINYRVSVFLSKALCLHVLRSNAISGQ